VDSGAVYRATTSLTFTQLFVNRRMMNEARWPNAKIDELVRMPRASTDTASTTSLSASAIPAGNWGGALVHVTTGEEWVSFTRKVKNYDESARRFDFSEPIAPSDAIRPEAGDPFYLFGHRGLLDTGGEWYLDDDHDTIYLWTPEGTNPASVTVEVKARNYAFDLSNRSHIELVGLHIFAAGVHMDRAHHCVVDGCHIRYVNHVREVNGYATNEGVGGVTSGSFNEWRNGSIAHAAVSGVVVNGNNNKVTNMLIHDVDYVGNGFAGISSGQKSWASADQNEYTHNTIYNTGGFGITHYKTTRSRISFNEVYNVMLLTKDGAPIYTWGTDGQGTEISYNHVHHNQTHWGAGIYLDDASSINHVVHHNLIEDIAWWGILFKGNNLIYNNTVIKAGDRGIFINQAAADLSGVKIVNNLLFQTGGALDFGREAQNVEQHHNAVCATDADRFPTDPTCIDSGEANAYTGEHRGTAPDIGAFEVGAPSWLPSVGCTTAERSPGGH
jgi:hypothetical protein